MVLEFVMIINTVLWYWNLLLLSSLVIMEFVIIIYSFVVMEYVIIINTVLWYWNLFS